jgi:hypothetical protein
MLIATSVFPGMSTTECLGADSKATIVDNLYDRFLQMEKMMKVIKN